MAMDLNLPIDGLTEQSRRVATSAALQLGFTGVAHSRTANGQLAQTDSCKMQPVALDEAPSSSSSIPLPSPRCISAPSFRQLSRLTVILDKPEDAAALVAHHPVLMSYDVIAVQARNGRAFQRACEAAEVDIITFDLSKQLPFRPRRPLVVQAIKRGVFFEICYASCLSNSGSRGLFAANAKAIVDLTRGRNLLVSSGATSQLHMRRLHDVANLLSLAGLPLDKARSALIDSPRAIIENGVKRRLGAGFLFLSPAEAGAKNLSASSSKSTPRMESKSANSASSREGQATSADTFTVPSAWNELLSPVEPVLGRVNPDESDKIVLAESLGLFEILGLTKCAKNGPVLPAELVGDKPISKKLSEKVRKEDKGSDKGRELLEESKRSRKRAKKGKKLEGQTTAESI